MPLWGGYNKACKYVCIHVYLLSQRWRTFSNSLRVLHRLHSCSHRAKLRPNSKFLSLPPRDFNSSKLRPICAKKNNNNNNYVIYWC